MKYVIDISEDVYTRLFDSGIQDNEIAVDDVCEMARAIRNGTPLPKGHGDLKDVSTIHLDKSLKKSTRSENYKDGYDNAIDDVLNVLNEAPTIIEADKEGAEK